MTFSKLCGLAAGAVVAVGLAGASFAQAPAAQPPAADNSPGYQPTGNDPNAAGPTGATRPLETPVLYVTAVEVIHSTIDPKVDIIRVSGWASSSGWSNPSLVPFFYGKPADDIIDLQFIATSPEQSQKAEGFVPLSATFTLEAGHPFKGVRVRASANALELKQMNGSAKAEIKADDCKECVGKKFVEKGQGPAGPGVIRGDDLPRGYRTISPTHGVAGITHNPNRINLILDDQSKVVMAFWE